MEQMILPERQAPQEYYNALPGPPPQSIEPVDDGVEAVPPLLYTKISREIPSVR